MFGTYLRIKFLVSIVDNVNGIIIINDAIPTPNNIRHPIPNFFQSEKGLFIAIM